jgi:hypothetical protein
MWDAAFERLKPYMATIWQQVATVAEIRVDHTDSQNLNRCLIIGCPSCGKAPLRKADADAINALAQMGFGGVAVSI